MTFFIRYSIVLSLLVSSAQASSSGPAQGSDGEPAMPRRAVAQVSNPFVSKNQPRQAPKFKDAYEKYISDNPECGQLSRATWIKHLSSENLKGFGKLYKTLDRGGDLTAEHQRLLNRSLYHCYHSFDLHGASFPSSLIEMLGGMPGEDAAAFFVKLCEITPNNIWETNWFDTVCDLFARLPESERTHLSLDILGSWLHVEKDQYGNDQLFDQNKASYRMMALNSLLNKKITVTMAVVEQAIKAGPSVVEIVQHRALGYACIGTCSALIASIGLISVLL